MAVTTTKTNKPLNPRGQDGSPLAYNRAKLFSGKALDFDGVNDEVGISDATDLWTGDFSVSWYGDLDVDANHFIFSSGLYTGSSQAGINFWYGGGANALSVHFPETDGTGQKGFNFGLAQDYTKLHRIDLIFVTSSRSLSLYQNGILIESKTVASNVDTSYMPNGWKIGRSYDGSFPTNGKISNFKTFNVALTAAQVADLYNNPEKVVPTGVDNTALKLWLPMQEGAGTTAYDGSGNGNHGTISGATYVHGIGAPVAQTAVIDWNKGTNEVLYSEQFDNAWWTKAGYLGGTAPTLTANYSEAPNGTNTAYRVQYPSQSGTQISSVQTPNTFAGINFIGSIYVRTISGTCSNLVIRAGETESVAPSFGTTWTRISITPTTNPDDEGLQIRNRPSISGDGTAIDILIWGAQINEGSSVGPYVRTGATAQTSPVLLPQGLTSGRDITGVNLFENVRKQGALNLDGNSWAEVHDNASLDFSSGITLEAWVYWDASGSLEGILGKWDSSADKRAYLLFQATGGAVATFNISANGTSTAAGTSTGTLTNNEWVHLVGTYDGANVRLYVNGSESSNAASTATLFTTDTNLDIGRFNNDNEYPDQIAQPRIYNRALTAAEVLQNYNSGKNTYTNN